jgi:hypothetical protein
LIRKAKGVKTFRFLFENILIDKKRVSNYAFPVMRLLLIISIVFASWQGFGNWQNPNLFHFIKTETAALPQFPQCRKNNTTSGVVLLGDSASGLVKVHERANKIEGELSMSFRAVTRAKDYG